jgi:hybrid cluster-associated redox disulfide protein
MHCLGCPHATAESLADACAAHGSDPELLVEKLNEYLSQKD